MQIVFKGENLHVISKSIFVKEKKKIQKENISECRLLKCLPKIVSVQQKKSVLCYFRCFLIIFSIGHDFNLNESGRWTELLRHIP